MRLPLKAVFLDLGGTLLDSGSDGRAHLEMLRDLREEVGLVRSPEELLQTYTTMSHDFFRDLENSWRSTWAVAQKVVAAILEEEGRTLTEELWQTFMGAYWREHALWIRPYPEVEEILGGLRSMGVHVGLLSDVDEDFLQVFFFRHPLDGFFDSITTSEEVGVAKPHREIFAKCLSKAGCAPRDAIHVGDSPERDAAGARAIGMGSILIASDRDYPSADYVVEDIRGAYDILRQLAAEGSG